MQRDEVQEQLDLRQCEPLLANEPVDADLVDGHIASYARVVQRQLLPGHPSMTEVHDRCVREGQRGDQGLEVMVSVDDVRRFTKAPQVVDDRDRGPSQFGGHLTQLKTERDWPVPSLEEGEGYVADVGFGSAPPGQGVIR